MYDKYLNPEKFDKAIDLYCAYRENPDYLYLAGLAYERTLYVYGKRYADLAESYWLNCAMKLLESPALPDKDL